MSIELVDQLGPKHHCDLPRQGLFPNVFWWTRNPLCVEGNVIQCVVCQKKWIWKWFGYAEMWDWADYETKDYQ